MEYAARALPLIISFYSQDDYYKSAAFSLNADCRRLGLDAEIVALDPGVGDDWASMCRRKVRFISDVHRRAGRPVLWLDVDSGILRMPEVLERCSADFASFLRGFRYLRDFDQSLLPRMFSPFALFFNNTSPARKFLDLMVELESAHVGAATDDYFLEEAWRRHRHQMSIMVLPPDLIAARAETTDTNGAFVVGISGNARIYKNKVAQQLPVGFTLERLDLQIRHEISRLMNDDLTVMQGADLFLVTVARRETSDELALVIAARILRSRGFIPAIGFMLRCRGKRPTTTPFRSWLAALIGQRGHHRLARLVSWRRTLTRDAHL